MITADKWSLPSTSEIGRLIQSTGVSKAELSKRIGYSKRAVEKWATGENGMSFCVWFTIREMARANARDVLESCAEHE